MLSSSIRFTSLLVTFTIASCVLLSSCDEEIAPPPPPPDYIPPGSLYALLPAGHSFDFSTGSIAPSGGDADFRYDGYNPAGNMVGLVAPSGVSFWTGDLAYFEYCLATPEYLPPPGGWTPSSGTAGSAGQYVRWLKAGENQYAMLFSVYVSQDYFGFYYHYPYGNYSWFDLVAPEPPTLISISSQGEGSLRVEWQASAAPDVAGYWVGYGDRPGSYILSDAGQTTSFTFTDMVVGSTYYMAVQAYDQEGNQSGFSNVISGIP